MDDDDLFFDDELGHDAWADTALDGRVRQQLGQLVPLTDDARYGWDDIQPRMVRARRRRLAVQSVAASLTLVMLTGAGLRVAGQFSVDRSSQVAADGRLEVAATEPTLVPKLETGEASSTMALNEAPAVVDDTVGDGSSMPDTTIEVGGESAVGDSFASSGESTTAPAPAQPSDMPSSTATTAPAVTPPAKSATTTSQSPATTRSTSRATMPTTAKPSTTTTARSSSTTSTTVVSGSLGTIDVSVSGSNVNLVNTHPKSGVSVEIHNRGPEKIELTFSKGSQHDDMSVYVRNGQLVVSGSHEDD